MYTQANLGVNAPNVTVLDGGQIHFSKTGSFANNFTITGMGWKESDGTQLGALGFNSNWTAGGGAITLTGNINLVGNARITTWDGGTTISGVISDVNGSNLSQGYGIEKTGAQTLYLTGLNTYTGATTLSRTYNFGAWQSGGILSVANLQDGGTASNIGASTNAAANLVFNGGMLQYTGSSTTIDRNWTFATGTASTIDVSNAATALTELAGPWCNAAEPAGHIWSIVTTQISLPSVPLLSSSAPWLVA